MHLPKTSDSWFQAFLKMKHSNIGLNMQKKSVWEKTLDKINKKLTRISINAIIVLEIAVIQHLNLRHLRFLQKFLMITHLVYYQIHYLLLHLEIEIISKPPLNFSSVTISRAEARNTLRVASHATRWKITLMFCILHRK